MWIRPSCFCLFLLWGFCEVPLIAEPVDYAGQVKPILRQHCFSCHGPIKQEGGLRLDSGQLIMQGGESGDALVAGAQTLWEREVKFDIRSDAEKASIDRPNHLYVRDLNSQGHALAETLVQELVDQ